MLYPSLRPNSDFEPDRGEDAGLPETDLEAFQRKSERATDIEKVGGYVAGLPVLVVGAWRAAVGDLSEWMPWLIGWATGVMAVSYAISHRDHSEAKSLRRNMVATNSPDRLAVLVTSLRQRMDLYANEGLDLVAEQMLGDATAALDEWLTSASPAPLPHDLEEVVDRLLPWSRSGVYREFLLRAARALVQERGPSERLVLRAQTLGPLVPRELRIELGVPT